MKKNLQFLFVFAAMILCCGNAFAGGGGTTTKNYYGKFTVTPIGGGKIYFSTTQQDSSEISNWKSTQTVDTFHVTGLAKDDAKTYYVYAQAQPQNGIEFYGWYEGETEIAPSNSTELTYTFRVGSERSEDNRRTAKSITAMFGGHRYNWYSLLKASVADENDLKGLIFVTTDKNQLNNLNLYTNSILIPHTAYIAKSGSTEKGAVTYYAYASPKRGYKFSSWTKGDNVSITEDTPTSISILSSSQNAQSPTIDSVKANFVVAESFNVTIQKPSEGHSITIVQSCNNINSLKFVREQVDSFALSSTAENDKILNAYSTDFFTLRLTNPIDYQNFEGWYAGEDLISTNSVITTQFSAAKTISARFSESGQGAFKVENDYYESLNEAVDTVGSSGVIYVVKNCYVTESVTIPSGVTLVVPFNDANNYWTDKPTMHSKNNSSSFRVYKENNNDGDWNHDKSVSVYRMLTLAEDVVLTVFGTINTSATRSFTINSGATSNYVGQDIPNVSGDCRLYGAYGCITMEKNSKIILKQDGKLQCWGRIRGEGTITAESGSEVRECFVYTDHRESNSYYTIATGFKCFPMNQYYIQDIQVPITYEYGSKGVLVTGLYVQSGSSGLYSGETLFVGDGTEESFVVLKNGATFTKSYSLISDRLNFDFNGDIDIKYFTLPTSYKPLTSEKHIFSLNNNWTFNVKSGIIHIQNELSLSAGAELNIAQDAKVVVDDSVSLYVFAEKDWGGFACRRRIIPLFLPSYELNSGWYKEHNVSTKYGNWGNSSYAAIRTHYNITDAIIDVNGELVINGGFNKIWTTQKSGLYTTTNRAQIISSQGDGKIMFLSQSGDQDSIPVLNNSGRYPEDDSPVQSINIPITPAQLKNADGSYTSTASNNGITCTYKSGYWLTKEINVNDTIINNDSVLIESGTLLNADTIIVSTGSMVNVENGGVVVANTLALNTTPSFSEGDNMGQSSQIIGNGSINATNAYIDIKMDPSGTLNSNRYYAFAVPFNVKVSGGIDKIDGDGGSSLAVTAKDFYAYTYSGVKRAANGKNGSAWVVVEVGDTLKPGVFYLMEFANNNYNIFRFHKVADDKLNNAGTIQLEAYGDGDLENPNNGWNGVANNSLQNVQISVEGASSMVAQVLEPDGSKFTTIDLSKVTFAMGTPMFIQVGTDAQASNVTNKSGAPERRLVAQVKNNTFGNYAVRIAAEGASKMADQLFISASEDASSNYVIGKDLVKMFMGDATVAQLWVNDYGKKLSMNQSVLIDDVATVSLTLYAPKAGNYQVYLRDIPEDATLYLLANGNTVANLNDGAYVVSLNKGENTQYGLRINTIKTIPDVVTSIDEAYLGNKTLNKILLNGNVYIIRDGKLFNTLGQQVR